MPRTTLESPLEEEGVPEGGYLEGSCVDLEKDPLMDQIHATWLQVDVDFYPRGERVSEGCSTATRVVDEALGELHRLARDELYQPEVPAGWVERLKELLPDPERFMAGELGRRAKVWEHFFKATGAGAAETERVLRWLKEGVACAFGEVETPGQQLAPFHKKKVEIVKEMLRRALPKESSVADHLEGGKPKPVHFPNHRSVGQYEEFVTKEVGEMVAKGVVKEWAAASKPVVVNGLRVVDDKAPKLRLCLNPMYINLFMRYKPVKYERVQDVAHLAEEGDFAFTTDDKSGYWQVPMHPAMWKYLAFMVGGRVYCFTHLPFGVAPACYIYTAIKQAIYRPLRAWGLRIVALIDDQISLQRGPARTAGQGWAMCRLLGALGWFLSWNKCQLMPTQLPAFLGFLVDLEVRSFRVPPAKEAQLEAMVATLSQQSGVSARDVARLAGRVMALSPALELSPLVARGMLKVIKGQAGWDEVYPCVEALKEDMDLLVHLLKARRATGRRWESRLEAFRVVGDASETALAAFAPGGELEAPIVIPFTPEELAAVRENRWSSTARELAALERTVQTVDQQLPGALPGKRLVYCTDSQPGMQAIMGMKGGPHTFPIVRRVLLLCASLDTQLTVEWRPREDKEQQHADDLSKTVDEGDWSLHPEIYRHVLDHPCLGGRQPTLDAFANPTNTKVPGAYFSMVLGPGCKGVDAFSQRWAEEEGSTRQLVFVNGPFGDMGRTIRKVIKEQVDSIIIVPEWPRPWVALLTRLPVVGEWALPHRQDLLVPGSLLPKGRGAHAPRYRLKAVYVVWPR